VAPTINKKELNMKKTNKKLLAFLATLTVGQVVEAKTDSAIYKVSTVDLAKTVSQIADAGFAIEIQAMDDGEMLVKIKEGGDVAEFIKDGEYFGEANVELTTLAGRCPPSTMPY